MEDLKAFFNRMPPISRYWFGLSVALPLLGWIGLLKFHVCMMDWTFISKFHIWRPLTSLFYYPITRGTGFHYLTNLFFLYNYSTRLETGEFVNATADYLFCLLYMWSVAVGLALAFDLYLLMDVMIMTVIYVWCFHNKNQVVTFYFGTKFKAQLLPFILLGFNLLINGSFIQELVGILIGHSYVFLTDIYPRTNGTSPLISTPNFMYSFFPRSRRSSGPSTSSSSSSSTPRSFGGHSWGSGRTLGGSN